MWFLLVKIFLLLCLAALLGAAFAWWWMRRRFVDVTEPHAELTRQVDAFLKQGKALTREDIDNSLSLALGAYRPPQPDLTPLQQRLVDLETAVSAPDQNAAAMNARLAALEQSVSAVAASLASMRSVHLEAIDQHLRGVSARIDNLRMPDIEGVNTRITALSSNVIEPRFERIEQLVTNFRVPETNLGPVHSGLAALQLAVENLELPEPNLAPFQQRLDELAIRPDLQRLTSEVETLALYTMAREPDLAPLIVRLSAVEAYLAAAPSSDMLIGTLAGIESDLDVLSRRPVGLDPLYSQLGALDASLASIRTELRGHGRTEALDRRLALLQEAVLNLPQPDYTRIDLALRSIESRFDLGALEDRLTAIEYSLTAVHHMLRSRGEPARPEPEPRVRAEVAPAYEPRPRPVRAVPEPVARPARRADPVGRARRVDDQANLLTHAAFGDSDDLELIVGVGPMLTELLHEIGVFYFWQIAEWTEADIAYVDGKLMHFRGRIERDGWVGQSRELAALPSSRKRPAGD